MSDPRYSYDESAEVWPYFVLTLLGVFVVPATVGQLVNAVSSARPGGPQVPGAPGQRPKRNEAFRKAHARSKAIRSPRSVLLIIGWALIAVLVGIINHGNPEGGAGPTDPAMAVFDPWAVLGISHSAAERQIKSAYRKLSVQFHPDKVRDIGELTKEMVEDRYVLITKAYQALTDETTRENFRLYGHPDGPQPVTHGIALPSFLVGGSGSVLVVAFYVGVVGIILPLFVGHWWAAQQKRTRRGLLQATASQFSELVIKEQPHFLMAHRIIDAILQSADMDAEVPHLTFEQRKAHLEAYLNRDEAGLGADDDHLKIATTTERLILGMQDIAAEFKSAILCERLVDLHRAVVQAVPMDLSRHGDYLQLPGAEIEPVVAHKQPDNVGAALGAARGFIPRIQILRAEFKVNGEDKVTTNSQTYLQIKFLVLPLGAPSPSTIDKEVLDAPVGDGMVEPSLHNRQQPKLPSANAPYFPLDVPNKWLVYLGGERDNKLVLGPVDIANMDLHNLQLSDDQIRRGDDLVVSTLNFPLPAASPPFPGSFAFRFLMLNSAYFGCDVVTRVSMDVVRPPPVAEPQPTEAEDDQDEEKRSSEDHDENGTDSSDEEDDLSDIDTDTEAEEESPTKEKGNASTPSS